MRRNRIGAPAHVRVARGRAVTLADRIAASGTAAAVVIGLVGAFVAGSFVLHRVDNPRAALPRVTHSTPARPVAISRPPSRRTARRAVRAPMTALVHDVRRIMAAEYGAAARQAYGALVTGKPVVQLIRTARGTSWAFGTAVIPVPPGSAAPPSTAFFVAHASHGTWSVALSGSSQFDSMIQSAQGAVVTPAEELLLARFSAAQAISQGAGGATQAPGLALPWHTGESWRLAAAFSSSIRTSSASMLAFSAGDGVVRAAGPGRLYRFCGRPGSDTLIEIIHPNGLATEYYQMRSETAIPDGSLVAAGTYLGMTGTSLPCGGTAAGPGAAAGTSTAGSRGGVVAFAVIGPAGPLSLDGLVIGGWTFRAQAAPNTFWAQRAATRVMLGGLLENFGAVAAVVPSADPAATPAQPPGPSPSPSPSPSAIASPPAGQ